MASILDLQFEGGDLELSAPDTLLRKLQLVSSQMKQQQETTRALEMEVKKRALTRDVQASLALKCDQSVFDDKMTISTNHVRSVDSDLRDLLDRQLSHLRESMQARIEQTAQTLDFELRLEIDKKATKRIDSVEKKVAQDLLDLEARMEKNWEELKQDILSDVQIRLDALRRDLFRELSAVTPLLTRFTTMMGNVQSLKMDFEKVANESREVSEVIRRMDADIVSTGAKVARAEGLAQEVQETVAGMEAEFRATADELLQNSVLELSEHTQRMGQGLEAQIGEMWEGMAELRQELKLSEVTTGRMQRNMSSLQTSLTGEMEKMDERIRKQQRETATQLSQTTMVLTTQLSSLHESLEVLATAVDQTEASMESKEQALQQQGETVRIALETLLGLTSELKNTGSSIANLVERTDALEQEQEAARSQLESQQRVLHARVSTLKGKFEHKLPRLAKKEDVAKLEHRISGLTPQTIESPRTPRTPRTPRATQSDALPSMEDSPSLLNRLDDMDPPTVPGSPAFPSPRDPASSARRAWDLQGVREEFDIPK